MAASLVLKHKATRISVLCKKLKARREVWKLSFHDIPPSLSLKKNLMIYTAPKSLQMVIAAMKLKDAYSLEGKL